MSLKKSFAFIFLLIQITSKNNITILESDLNKAISCQYIITRKYNFSNQKIDQKLYSSSLLSCFITISEKEAKNILNAIQHNNNYLTTEYIERLINVDDYNSFDKGKLTQESKKLELALKEFNNIGNKVINENIKEIKSDEKYSKSHPWKEYKLTKFMIATTKILKFLNKIGKFIVIIACIYLFIFLMKMIGTNSYNNTKKIKGR